MTYSRGSSSLDRSSGLVEGVISMFSPSWMSVS